MLFLGGITEDNQRSATAKLGVKREIKLFHPFTNKGHSPSFFAKRSIALTPSERPLKWAEWHRQMARTSPPSPLCQSFSALLLNDYRLRKSRYLKKLHLYESAYSRKGEVTGRQSGISYSFQE